MNKKHLLNEPLSVLFIKKNIYLFFLAIVFIPSCSSHDREDENIQLSFYDFKLGASLDSCITLLLNNKPHDVSLCHREEEGELVQFTFNCFLPDYSSPSLRIPAKVQVDAYQDSIFCILINSEEDRATESFRKMYCAKYGKPHGFIHKKWDFKNSKIELYSISHTEKHKYFVPSRAHLKLNNPENYFKEYTIKVKETFVRYSDKHLTDIAANYIDGQERAYESKKKEEELKQEEIEREERNIKLSQKKFQQKEILNNLDF